MREICGGSGECLFVDCLGGEGERRGGGSVITYNGYRDETRSMCFFLFLPFLSLILQARVFLFFFSFFAVVG